jgi:hypothetical protein
MLTKDFSEQSSEGLSILDVEQPSLADEGTRVTRRSKSRACPALVRANHYHHNGHNNPLGLPIA